MAISTVSRSKVSKPQVARRPIVNSKDVPATQGMLQILQKQFKADLKSLSKDIDSKFKKVDARFNQVDARFDKIESGLSQVLSEVHRIALLVEEQNKRNIFVLEGYDQLYKRQDRLEKMVDTRILSIEEIVIKKI